jgi:LPXTG-site transpeptidase (sortase) family protein
VQFWPGVLHSPSGDAVSTRSEEVVLGVIGALALLAAGGLLVGLGSSADSSAGSPPGATDTGVRTGDRAAARDTAELRASPAGRDTNALSTRPVQPQRLRIPSLDVDAPVLPIAADGAQLAPPSDPQTVGWWSAGARPGAELGTAILTGHTMSTGGGVFDDLDQMRPGQRVLIHSSGPRLRLQVTSVTVYHKAALAEHAAEIFDQGSAGRVALVTCEDWDGAEYLSNVVVIAAPTG